MNPWRFIVGFVRSLTPKRTEATLHVWPLLVGDNTGWLWDLRGPEHERMGEGVRSSSMGASTEGVRCASAMGFDLSEVATAWFDPDGVPGVPRG